MQIKAIYFVSLFYAALLGAGLLLAQYPTRVDLEKQSRNARPLVEVVPGWGTIVIGSGNKYYSQLSGAAVVYRTSAPKRPGPCELEGTGAMAVDAEGYFYMCVVIRGATVTTPSPTTHWMRTQQPLVETW